MTSRDDPTSPPSPKSSIGYAPSPPLPSLHRYSPLHVRHHLQRVSPRTEPLPRPLSLRRPWCISPRHACTYTIFPDFLNQIVFGNNFFSSDPFFAPAFTGALSAIPPSRSLDTAPDVPSPILLPPRLFAPLKHFSGCPWGREDRSCPTSVHPTPNLYLSRPSRYSPGLASSPYPRPRPTWSSPYMEFLSLRLQPGCLWLDLSNTLAEPSSLSWSKQTTGTLALVLNPPKKPPTKNRSPPRSGRGTRLCDEY
jgi:hypothetical protein